MKRYLFFLRGHNDTDNIAPAIYFLLQEREDHVVTVVFYHIDYAFREAPVVQLLAETFGPRLELRWIGEFLGQNYERHFRQLEDGYSLTMNDVLRLKRALRLDAEPLRKLLALRKTKSGEDSEPSGPRKWLGLPHVDSGSFVNGVRRLSFSPHVTDDVRDGLMRWAVGSGPLPAMAIFDYQRGSQMVGFFSALRRLGVARIVRLPVSPMVNIDVMRQTRYTHLDREVFAKEFDFTGYDAVAYTDRFYPEELERFYSVMGWPSPLGDKLRVLGAIRYCPEWLRLRPTPPPFDGGTSSSPRKRRLVFFLSRAGGNAFWDEVLRTIELLKHFDGYEVIVQPHPRDRADVAAAAIPELSVRTDVPSPSLIAWADVVMLWGSSIGLEALERDKTLLCVDYLSANLNVFVLHEVGIIVRSRDELVFALKRLETDPQWRPYDAKAVERLLGEMVFTGDMTTPVPERYLRYLHENEALQAPDRESLD